MTILALSFFLGALLTKVVPGRETAQVYVKPTEADFQELLRRRGLKWKNAPSLGRMNEVN